jgi:hypothetical protein
MVLVLVVPLIGNAVGLSELIYGEPPPFSLLWPVALALSPLALPSLLRWLRPGQAKATGVEFLVPGGAQGPGFKAMAFVAVWCLLFVLTGGLTVRETDVALGYAARSQSLIFVLLLTNQVLMLTVAWWMPHSGRGPMPMRGLRTLLSVIMFGCIGLSGSRGIVFTLFLAYAFGTAMFLGPPGQVATAPEQPSLMKRVVTPRRLIALGALLVFFAIWGSIREQESNVQFSALYRLSEPYWYRAYRRFLTEGPAPELMWDTIERVLAIPGRLFGYVLEGSIDGNNMIIEKYLGIPFREGVSLPITLMGHGLLFGGPWGLGLFSTVAALLLRGAFALYKRLPALDGSHRAAFIGLVFAKACFLYPKSLSGIVLVLFYENLRDYVLLALLSRRSGGPA